MGEERGIGERRDVDVAIRPWSEGDLQVLERLLGDPAMTEHLGGPETSEKLLGRHREYCRMSASGDGGTFMIVVGPEGAPAGWTGYWETGWRGQLVWEAGWSVLPEYQGRGVATKATTIVVERARAEGTHRFMHAFPSIDNVSSNAVCRKVGFALQDVVDIEYPPGRSMRCNNWCLDLFD
jgi:RimJ/RimL family protein N-acetyltransferase